MNIKNIVLPTYLFVLSMIWITHPDLYYKLGTTLILLFGESIINVKYSLPLSLLVISIMVNAAYFLLIDLNGVMVFQKKLINKEFKISTLQKIYPVLICLLQIAGIFFVYVYTYSQFGNTIGNMEFTILSCISYYLVWSVFRLFVIVPFFRIRII